MLRRITAWPALILTAAAALVAASCADSPTRATIVIGAPTPQNSGLFPGSARELRPVLAVANASTVGPVGGVAYQFELATNSAFSPMAVTGIVDQQAPRTLFSVPTDLVPGTTYFWRARTMARGSAVTSPYSPVERFATIAAQPDRSALRLYLADSCATFFGEREFTIYGDLTVSGTVWHFAIPPPPPGFVPPDLVMDLRQSGDRVSGTVRGRASDPLGFPVALFDGVSLSEPASAAGAVVNGTASGTLRGVAQYAHPTFGIGGVCADLPWVLTPSR